MWRATLFAVVVLATMGSLASPARADEQAERAALTRQLWPQTRIREALRAVEKQYRDGLLSERGYRARKQLLESRLAGTHRPQSLAVVDPPLDFIQNGGFEKINKNSAKNRSRWLWWGGWDWGGDYENSWEDRPEYVHSGKFSARIACVGRKGRIGIMTPGLPAIPGATKYVLRFWARGEGDNMLFVNFENGARGELRERLPAEWKQYTVNGTPAAGDKTYGVYFYAIGEGTIWLDDVTLVPEGGKLNDE
jgi:hypothetical protein